MHHKPFDGRALPESGKEGGGRKEDKRERELEPDFDSRFGGQKPLTLATIFLETKCILYDVFLKTAQHDHAWGPYCCSMRIKIGLIQPAIIFCKQKFPNTYRDPD